MSRDPSDITISIVTVCLNSEATLEPTILSILGQDHPRIEYILVDGDSTDGTLPMIRRYEPRLARWISEPDRGIYDAMNKGIGLATGDLIGLINSGDHLTPGALSRIAQAYAEAPVDIVYGDIVAFDEDRGYELQLPSTTAPRATIHKAMCIPHQAMFVSRNAYQRFGTYDLYYRLGADYDFLVRALLQGASVTHVPTPVCRYRLGGVSGNHAKTFAEHRRIKDAHFGPRLAHRIQYGMSMLKTGIYERLHRHPTFVRLYESYKRRRLR